MERNVITNAWRPRNSSYMSKLMPKTAAVDIVKNVYNVGRNDDESTGMTRNIMVGSLFTGNGNVAAEANGTEEVWLEQDGLWYHREKEWLKHSGNLDASVGTKHYELKPADAKNS